MNPLQAIVKTISVILRDQAQLMCQPVHFRASSRGFLIDLPLLLVPLCLILTLEAAGHHFLALYVAVPLTVLGWVLAWFVIPSWVARLKRVER
jgi:hypothetical protein